MRSRTSLLALLLWLAALAPALAQFTQQGNKLVGSGAAASAQGAAAALSADGNTALVGSGGAGAWVWTRSGGVWTQQGSKLVGNDGVAGGWSVALSADGNTALIGSPNDNSNIGAAFVFVRSGSTWTQQGPKLVGTAVAGPQAEQGIGVSLSADGNTAIVGGSTDDSGIGAAWVFTRGGGIWTQQGSKLVGSNSAAANQGTSVALSGDGNTAIVGGPAADGIVGAAWVYTRSGGIWTEQRKLTGSGAPGLATQGQSVALSADGNTAMVGGYYDNNFVGAAWVFTRSGSTWTQQGNKLVGSGGDTSSFQFQGYSVALSADGNTAFVGGYADHSSAGAAWVWTRSGGVWTQQGAKLVGSGASANADQGYSLALSRDGNTALVGGVNDAGGVGAVWAYVRPALTVSPTTAMVASGNAGGPFTPVSFDYILSANAGATHFSIGGAPDWVDQSVGDGVVPAGGQVTLTLTVRSFANGLTPGVYNQTMTITNTDNGSGTVSIDTTLTVGDVPPTTVVSAVLPGSRSVQVGNPATAFMTIINNGATPAVICVPTLGSALSGAGFDFQTTDPNTNAPTGSRGAPANIAPGKSQSYVFAITPNAPVGPINVPISTFCANAPAPAVISGVNTLLLSASATPVPDIIALPATVSNDGVVNIPGAKGIGAFAVASVNVGATADITVSGDTGLATLPVTITVCQTNSAGTCINPAFPGAASVAVNIAANATPTFSVFVKGADSVPFDPGKNRVFVRFKDSGGLTRGSTSVAVRTQ